MGGSSAKQVDRGFWSAEMGGRVEIELQNGFWYFVMGKSAPKMVDLWVSRVEISVWGLGFGRSLNFEWIGALARFYCS